MLSRRNIRRHCDGENSPNAGLPSLVLAGCRAYHVLMGPTRPFNFGDLLVSLFATSSRRSCTHAYLTFFLCTLAEQREVSAISPELRLYVYQTARHAAMLLTQQDHRIPRKYLEAVDLAFEMREDDSLARDILDLKTEDDFAPELAKRLLQHLRSDIVGDGAAVAG